MKIFDYCNLETFTFENDVNDVKDTLTKCYPDAVFTVVPSPFYEGEYLCTSPNKSIVGVKYIDTGSLYDDVLKPLKLSITATFAAFDYFTKLRIYAVRSGVTDVKTLALLFQKAAKTDTFLKVAEMKDNF